MNKTRPCLKDFLKASRRCLKTEDKPSLDITLRMIDSAIDFMCQNDGDGIALEFFLTASFTAAVMGAFLDFLIANFDPFFLTARYDPFFRQPRVLNHFFDRKI